MGLKEFLKAMPDDDARERFAAECETTLGHMRNCAYGQKQLAAANCVLVEQRSDSAVRRWDLRPDDWHRIWPELINSPGAPAVAVAEEAAK